MENVWKMLEEGYAFLHSDKIDEAESAFKKMYDMFQWENVAEWDDNFWNYVSCLLWLWEIFMKKWEMKTSLKYYVEWNELSGWKDFNILFNLWVVHRNLWDEESCQKFLDQAKLINPTDQNLLRFMWEAERNTGPHERSGENFDASFEEKVQAMLKEINKSN